MKINKSSQFLSASKKVEKVTLSEVMAKKSYYQTLKKLRKQKGYTLADLAQLTGFSPSYISRLEAGDRRYNTDVLTKFAQVLGCSEYDLLQKDATEPKAIGYTPAKDIPVYTTISGAAVSGKNFYSIANFDRAETKTFRLPQLLGVKSAFALFIVDEMNAPKYRIGDMIFVNTDKPIAKKAPVLLVGHGNEIIIGELIDWNDADIEIAHFGSNNIVKFLKTDLQGFYSIIGSFESE